MSKMKVVGKSAVRVDGLDQVRSTHIDYRADQTLQLQAENLIANATNLVKVDGEQIHLG